MRKKIFALLVLCVFLFSSAAAFAGSLEVRVAPSSEAFLNYIQETQRRGVAGSLTGNGYVPSPVDLSHLKDADYSSFLKSSRRRASFPDKYDPRPNGITPVKSQKPYNDCWAFSATGAMEASYLKAKKESISLSEMHLVLSAYKTGTGFSGANSNPLNNGGFDNISIATLARWAGPVLESYLPHAVFVSDSALSTYPVRLHLQGAFHLNMQHDPKLQEQPSNELRKTLIMEYGAISVGMYTMSFKNSYNETYFSWNTVETQVPDHAALIVGWDDNFSKDKFNVKPTKDGAWLVKNSRGTDWGDGGYFWLSYEDHSLLDGVAYLVEEPDNYKHNYGYDDLGWCNSVNVTNTNVSWAANVFTSQFDSEALEAVSFYTTAANAVCDVYVYTNLSSVSPISGTESYRLVGATKPIAGYHTLKLDKSISLTKGSRFSVVVRMQTPGYNFPLAVEAPIKAYSDNAVSGYNESYFSNNGSQWEDGKSIQGLAATKNNINACIKAFTSSGTGSATGSGSGTATPAPVSGGGGGGGCSAGMAGILVFIGVAALRKRQ